MNGMVSMTQKPEEDSQTALDETLYLLSLPGMLESIREGLATPIEACDEDPGW